jgi:hypothetical protein
MLVGINCRKTAKMTAEGGILHGWPAGVDVSKKLSDYSWTDAICVSDFIATKATLSSELVSAIERIRGLA